MVASTHTESGSIPRWDPVRRQDCADGGTGCDWGGGVQLILGRQAEVCLISLLLHPSLLKNNNV